MGKWLVTLLLVVAAALAAAWYWLYRPQQQRLERVLVQAADCASEAHRLRSQNADLETIRDELRKASAGLQQQVAAKEQEMAGLRSTHEELIGALKQEIADKQIEVERVRDRLRVDMVDEVLFDSGVADLKPEGAVVLKKIGAVLAHAADRGIEVQGHTDNVPIRGVLARRYPTNWELSAARATNVVRFLQDQAGLDPKRISAAAYGEHQPRVSNDTDEGRRRNRRIELLLLPLPPASQNTSSGAPAPVATPAASPSPRAGGWEAQGRKAD